MKTKFHNMLEQQMGMTLKKYLHEQYVVKEKTLEEIANDLGVSKAFVFNWCKKYNIQTRKIKWNKGLTKAEMQEIINMNKQKK